MKVAEGISEAQADRDRFRPRVNLKTMIALVACCGAIFWAWRAVLQSDPVNRMVFALRSGTVEERRVAARELGTATPAEVGQAVPALIADLGDDNEEVAAQAARSLGAVGTTAATALNQGGLVIGASEALAQALDDSRAEVHMAAVHSLGLMGSRAGITPPEPLIWTLQDHGSEELRADAATALGQFRTTTQGAIRALFDALVDDTIPVRRACDAALRRGNLVPPPELVPALIRSLREGRDSRESLLAASLLGRLGPAAEEAIPRLRTLVDDSDRSVAMNAKDAIASIEGKAKPRQATAKAPGRRPASIAD